MNEDKREIRNIACRVQLTEAEGESRGVEGYALLFDTPSDGLSFEETIERGALDGVIERSDVFALLNHSMGRGILARSIKGQGSLSLTVDAKGLKYWFESPKTPLGDELLENLRRGEITESSFSFDVEKDTWEKKSDGTWKRTVQKIGNLYDVSPVYNAAYSKTSVYLRGREEAEKEIEQAEQRKLEAYYRDIKQSLNL